MSRRVGRYEVLRRIGSGGMASVYLARQIDLDRLVALKELSAARALQRGAAQRFLRESRVAASLAHPNIVTVHEYFERGGTPYIAMEYLARGSLRPFIGHLSLAQAGGVLGGVLAGLAHAERRGIVHRDLKPENLLVTDDGQVKITDFGIAKATQSMRASTALTTAGTTLGTPNYMAPEQAMGRAVGPWSDLYAVGIMSYEMLVGEVPFHDTEEPMAVLMRQVHDPVPSVAAARPDLDPAISGWVDRLLVKDPEQRTRSAVDAWQALEEALIAGLGPRWNRSASLTGGPAPATPAMETPATDRARAVARTPILDRARRARTVAPRSAAPTEARGRRRAPAVVAAALLLVGAAAVALGIEHHTAAGSAEGLPTHTSNGSLALAVPAGYRSLPSIPSTGLPLTGARALAPEGRTDAPAVVYGVMPTAAAGNSALLPPALLAALGGAPSTVPARTRVTLQTQELRAWRYRRLRPLGSVRELTAYVVPTDAGVATVACVAPPGGAALPAGRCEAIASTLQLRKARPYPVGPSEAYAASLTTIMGSLRTAADADRHKLATAATWSGRASAAKALAADHRGAARRVGALALSPADHTANQTLVGALQRAGRAYAAVAKAARKRRVAALTAAATKAQAAEKGIDAALAGLRAAGYTAGSGGVQATKDPGSPSSPAQPKRAAPRCSSDEQSDDASDDAGGGCGEA
jgi:hypothetical protein